MSVDALRERFSQSLPSEDRLSMPHASRQMEILQARLTEPEQEPGYSFFFNVSQHVCICPDDLKPRTLCLMLILYVLFVF